MASTFPSPSHAQAPVAEARRGCGGSALVMEQVVIWWGPWTMLGLWLSPHPGCSQPKQAPTGNEPALAIFCSRANTRYMAWICTVTQHWKASHSDREGHHSSDTQSVWFLLPANPSSFLTMQVHRVATRALCFLQPRLPYWFWVCTTTWLGNKNFSHFIIAVTSGARGLWFYTTKKPSQRKPEPRKPLLANKGTTLYE